MIKVSIVIPVYNVELYLKEALDSVINQTLKDIEIILINDGSTDNSLEIIKEYKVKDKRVLVINQENQGLSGARNTGLKIAKGKYIYFMDSDDYIDLDTLELCYEKSEKGNLDLIFFDALPFTKDNFDINLNAYNRSGKLNSEEINSGIEYLKKLQKYKLYKSSVVLNFIKLDYLKEINLNFYPKILHEDELFTPILFLNAGRVSYLDRKFFKRRMRIGSIMTSSKGEKNIIGYLVVARELKKILNKEKNFEKKFFLKNRITGIIGGLGALIPMLEKEMQKKYKQEIKSEFKDYLDLKSRIKLDYPNVFRIVKKIKDKEI